MSDPFERYQKKGLQHMTHDDNLMQDIPPAPNDLQGPSEFVQELESVINRHSMENASGTPDFVLAIFLGNCLDAFNTAIRQRGNWRGESVELPALQGLRTKKIPLVMYTEYERHEIGEATVKITPFAMVDRIVGVLPIFEGDEVQNGEESGTERGGDQPISSID